MDIQCVPGGTRGTYAECRRIGRRCEPMEETKDVLRFVHLRMAIFGHQKAGWHGAPVLHEELRRIYDPIMEPVRIMRSEAARIGGMVRARRIAENQWTGKSQTHNDLDRIARQWIRKSADDVQVAITINLFK
ncbi:hypothetical protein TEQG_02527 [Trichophyton equinum CBS 127.97]|uniref:Uncharacterized protein n=1 Tax=Trichophyton equinum (strain ATCC MYA-4606 / CBS 127.97) TaxID=559882 RepID=F2PNM9_TRIEC|nr:hypothetical protein TEQG_02527 [Trichophyton equinum CBS 127.97]